MGTHAHKYVYKGVYKKTMLYYRCAVACQPKRALAVYKACHAPLFNAEKVDTAVWNWIRGLLLDPKQLEDGLRRYQERTA